MLEFLILYAISAVITLSVQRSIVGAAQRCSIGNLEKVCAVVIVMAIHPFIWVAWFLKWALWIAEEKHDPHKS